VEANLVPLSQVIRKKSPGLRPVHVCTSGGRKVPGNKKRKPYRSRSKVFVEMVGQVVSITEKDKPRGAGGVFNPIETPRRWPALVLPLASPEPLFCIFLVAAAASRNHAADNAEVVGLDR
jgi:hypothetical protein